MDVLFGDGNPMIGAGSYRRVGLKLDACDVSVWKLMSAAGLKRTIRYICDDFNILSLIRYREGEEVATPLMQAIWDILSPGGILVSAWNSANISIEAAREICGLFDVYITDDVYSCVQHGYVAAPWNGVRVHPMFGCVCFFAKHPDDERLLGLSQNTRNAFAFADVRVAWKTPDKLFKVTENCVSTCRLALDELGQKWKLSDLSYMKHKQLLAPEELSEYTRVSTMPILGGASAVKSAKLAEYNVSNVIKMGCSDSTGVFLFFVKKDRIDS
jgi:hypothetical protein